MLKNSGTDKAGKTVEIQVYSRKLSPNTYLRPAYRLFRAADHGGEGFP